MLKVLKVVIPAVMLLTSTAVYAADAPATTAPKIGVFDMQQLMNTSPLVQQLNKQLQDQFKPRQDKIVALQKQLGDEIDQMNKKGASMNNDDRNKLRDKIVSDRSAYQTMAQSYQQDLQAAQNTAMQKLMAQLQDAVNSVADKDGYSMIVQRGAVLYFNPQADVTKQVMQDMPK